LAGGGAGANLEKPLMAVEVEKMGPGKWRTRDRKGRAVWMRYDGQSILVVRPRKHLKSELLLRKQVYNAFGPDLPDWYAGMILETVVEHPRHAQGVLDTIDAKQMMDQVGHIGTEPTTVAVTEDHFTEDQLEEPLDDLLAHLRPDEKPITGAPVGYLSQSAILLVTEKRILWRVIEPGRPVLTLNFSDIYEVTVDGGSGVTLMYRPADSPDDGRLVSANGALDAEFVFRRGSEDVRELVLGRAHREVELRAAGAMLASGAGYLSGALNTEQYEVDVEAHESGLVIYLGALPMWTCSYAAATSFRVDPVPEELKTPERLGVGGPAIWLSLAGEGLQDRWRLVVKADDVLRWRVILEHFGVRESPHGPA
jgi:hypothetical protein